jgi:hypothetical protein
MAESESSPTSEAQNEALSDASAEALVPAETWTQEGEMAPSTPIEAEQTPFRDDQLLFFEGALIRNELADAQADPEAARGLAARHWSRLLYSPTAPWRGRSPYPQVNLPKPDKQTP